MKKLSIHPVLAFAIAVALCVGSCMLGSQSTRITTRTLFENEFVLATTILAEENNSLRDQNQHMNRRIENYKEVLADLRQKNSELKLQALEAAATPAYKVDPLVARLRTSSSGVKPLVLDLRPARPTISHKHVF